jgi:hypothetical protein
MTLHYGENLASCPLKHLIMLAPANHGSALAHLGKSRLGRIRAMTQGIEPGVRVLDWLELGSDASWALNEAWLRYDCVRAGIYPFTLIGQSLDRRFYDHLNSYTGEPGSDGVVRVAAANMNYGLIRLRQRGDALEPVRTERSPRTAFGVLPGLAHSGGEMGIIASVTAAKAAAHPAAQWVLKCLGVASAADYAAVADRLAQVTGETQKRQRVEVVEKITGTRKFITSRYAMVVFRMVDDRGNALSDYDLFITGGPRYSPDDLPPGFYVDRQRNTTWTATFCGEDWGRRAWRDGSDSGWSRGPNRAPTTWCTTGPWSGNPTSRLSLTCSGPTKPSW